MPAHVLDVAPTYEVLRPFNALGRLLETGEVVDCTGWRNVQPLIDRRYLKPLYAPAGSAVPVTSRGPRGSERITPVTPVVPVVPVTPVPAVLPSNPAPVTAYHSITEPVIDVSTLTDNTADRAAVRRAKAARARAETE